MTLVPVLIFALAGGALTILSPCTLPVVPLVLGGAAVPGRQRVAGVFLGFGVTFVVTTVLLASALAALDVTTDRLRLLSAVLLGLFGAMLALPRLARRVELATAPLARAGTRIAGDGSRSGLVGGILVGAAIGLIWAPCVGPVMAGVIAAAAVFGPSPETILIAIAYVVGASIPLAAIAIWGRRAVLATGSAQRRARLQRAFGVAMVVASIVVLTGQDLAIEAGVASVLPPAWDGALAAAGPPTIEQEGAAVLPRGSDPSSNPAVALEDLGPAPELTGITAWINSDPLTLASLRGKVVLVHFWTFGCINCIHVQPYVKAWYDQYSADGFVVVGVHTPELSFERDIGNVRDAVAKDDVRFPVAFDPAYATWNAYRNQYWPAFFFVDKNGRIRHTHFGEGDYDGSEQVIRELLAEPA